MRIAIVLALAACTSTPVDETPGTIALTVTSPMPGDELLASEHPSLVVTGTVSTTNPQVGELEAWINGVRVRVDIDGSFTAELVPEVGINHIKVEGGDGIGALVGQQLDVMWSPGYIVPIDGSTGFDVPSALELRLGQRFFDGRLLGTTLDKSTDPVVATDLASALELIMWHIDLASLVGSGIQFGSGDSSLDITIPSATPASIAVDAEVIHDPVKAIDLKIDMLGVFLEMDGTFQFGSRTLIIDGGIGADLHATARLALAVAEDGTIDVTVTDVTATVGPLVPAFTGPDGDELDAFITVGNNDFRELIEGLVEAELIPTFTQNVPPLLETLLGATDRLLDNVMFTLDTGLGTPVMLALDGKIAALDAQAGPPIGNAAGHITVRQDLSIRTATSPVHPSSRGAPQLAADGASAGAFTAGLHLTLKQELLNSLLHSLWNGGLLDGSATFSGLAAEVSAKLPPVVRPTPLASACKIDNERCDVVLQLGQLEVTLPDLEQTFGINATAGARVVVDGNRVSLAIQEVPEVTVWEITTNESGLLSTEAVEDLVVKVVWPELFGAIGENLSIELPIPSLSELGLDQLAPALATAELRVDMSSSPAVSESYLRLGAGLSLTTPQP